MKRWLIAIILFFGIGALSFWFGGYFTSYANSKDTLRVEKPVMQLLSVGDEAVFELHGSGLDQDVSVSMVLDVGNSEAVVGSFPLNGVFNESLLFNDILYLASADGGIQILNVKDPLHPKILGAKLVGRTIIDIYRNENYLFLSQGKFGLSIMQIQPDGFLQHVTDIHIGDRAYSSSYFGGYLYIAAGSAGLFVYDINQLDQIKLVQVVKPSGAVSDLVIAGKTLYLAVAGSGVEVYHLGVQQYPEMIGEMEILAPIYDLLVHQKQLYVATKQDLSLYDIGTAGNMKLLRQWDCFGSARKLFSGLERVYVVDNFVGFRIVDAEQESPPDLINLNIDPRTIAVTTDHIFVGGTDKGLMTVAKQELSSRQKIKKINTSGNSRDLFIAADWLYIADAHGGVVLHDLVHEDAPVIPISLRRGESFAAGKGFLYVANSLAGIEAFDISSPGSPKSVALWPDLPTNRLALVDNYLVTTQGRHGIKLIDIADIQHPLIVDRLPDVHALDLVTDGNYVYIASKMEGLLIYEITADATLRRLSSLLPPFPMSKFGMNVAVEVQYGIVYAINWRTGLQVIDARKPTEPVILSTLAIPGSCKDLLVDGDKVYVTSRRGVSLVSLADPHNMVLLNTLYMRGLSKGIAVNNGHLYLAHRHRGVTVVSVPVVANPLKVISNEKMVVKFASATMAGRYNLQINKNGNSVIIEGAAVYKKKAY